MISEEGIFREKRLSICFYMDKFHECQDKLMKAYKERLEQKSAAAEQEFVNSLATLDKFEEFKKSQGYGMDIQ